MQRAWLWSLLLASGCTLRMPEPTGIPFVSEQVIGHWVGTWSVPLPGQKGEADVLVTRDTITNEVSWKMSLDGGILSGPDAPPLLFDLRGQDDVHFLNLQGDGPILGHIDITIDEQGLIEGLSVPGNIPDVDIVGLVGKDYVRLDFLLLEIVHGNAVVTVEGRSVDDVEIDTDNPFDDPAESPVDSDAAAE